MSGENKARILLVDDEPTLRLTMTALFEDEGFQIDVASSLREAIEHLRGPQGYGVVLLDQNLGDGSGIDLVPVVRERQPGAKVLLISGDFERGATPPRG